jgi:hypothetical protein
MARIIVPTPLTEGMTLISEQVASANSSISFSSIPGTYKQLILIWYGIYHSANGSFFPIRFNNDSTASAYLTNSMSGTGSLAFRSGVSQDSYIAGDGSSFATIPFGESVTNSTTNLVTMAQGVLTIDNYASTTKNKNFQTNYAYYKNAATVGYANVQMLGQWINTGAITSIDIVRGGGSATFTNATSTSIRLYGVS